MVWSSMGDVMHGKGSYFQLVTRSWKRRRMVWDVAPLAICRQFGGRAFEGVEIDFVHLRSSQLSRIDFWGTHEIPIFIEDWVTIISFVKFSTFWHTSCMQV